ncbi:hypothetical protein C0J52_20650 [Blattella germanica]|nr:hypothetical protein C0J52_20650 [Blattella germanica]
MSSKVLKKFITELLSKRTVSSISMESIRKLKQSVYKKITASHIFNSEIHFHSFTQLSACITEALCNDPKGSLVLSLPRFYASDCDSISLSPALSLSLIRSTVCQEMRAVQNHIERKLKMRPEDVARAVALTDYGRSVRYIANALNMPRSTVYDAIKRYRETEEYTRRPVSGRPRATTRNEDSRLKYRRAIMTYVALTLPHDDPPEQMDPAISTSPILSSDIHQGSLVLYTVSNYNHNKKY